MKNLFGDEVKPRKLSFKWLCPHLEVFVNDHWCGMVSPNGWQGHSMNVHYAIGEPVMNSLNLWFAMSLDEMQLIMAEWKKHMEPERCMQIVISSIAEEKKFSFNDTLKYLKDHDYPLYFGRAGGLIREPL